MTTPQTETVGVRLLDEVTKFFDWLADEGIKLSFTRTADGQRYVLFEAATWKLMQAIQGPPLSGALELYRRIRPTIPRDQQWLTQFEPFDP